MDSNIVSTGGFKDFVLMALAKDNSKSMFEKLKELAFNVVENLNMMSRDEILYSIVMALDNEVYPPVVPSPHVSEEKSKKFVILLKGIYDAIASQQLLKSRLQIAERIFDHWTPCSDTCGYFSFSPEVFKMLIEIYDQSDEKQRKILDEKFKRKLDQVSWQEASRWLLTPGLTDGLGTHLAKCRARAGGFWLALNDVSNAELLFPETNKLSPAGKEALKKACLNVCDFDDEISFLMTKADETFMEIGYKARAEITYDLPKRILCSITLDIIPGSTPAQLSVLTTYVGRTLKTRLRNWFRPGVKTDWPKILVEVFEQGDFVGKFDVI